MKRPLKKMTDPLAGAAMPETGVKATPPVAKAGMVHETIEENLIEVAFAEAADYDDIHKAILREHRAARDRARPDDRQNGDNGMRFRHAA